MDFFNVGYIANFFTSSVNVNTKVSAGFKFIHYDKKGEIYDTYTVISELGSGAFGVVYKVKNNKSDILALKIISHSSDKHKKKATKELESLEKLNHKNIISHKDNFTTKGENGDIFCLVTEYVDGKTMLEYLKEFTEPDICWVMSVFYQLLTAFNYVHNHKHVHQDLKPDNIMIYTCGDDIILKVIDFGLAVNLRLKEASRSMSGLSKHSIGGNFAYMAPEIVNIYKTSKYPNKDKPKYKVDIYAIGVMLYQSLTLDTRFLQTKFGCDYFTDNDPITENVRNIGFRNFLKKCITYLPKDRKSACELLKEDLIRGWIHLNDNTNTTFNIVNDITVDYLTCFVEVLTLYSQDKYKYIFDRAVAFILKFLEDPECRKMILQLPIIPYLCDIIKLPTAISKISRKQFLEKEDSSSTINRVIDFNTISGNFKDKKDKKGIDILAKLLSHDDSRVDTAIQLYNNNDLLILIEKYKQYHPKMDIIIANLCKVSFIQNILRKEYGLDCILRSFLNNLTTVKYYLRVYEQLYSLDNTSLNLLYNTLENRKKYNIINLILSNRKAHKFINLENFTFWEGVFDTLKYDDKVISSLISLIFPIHDIIKYTLNYNSINEIYDIIHLLNNYINLCDFNCKISQLECIKSTKKIYYISKMTNAKFIEQNNIPIMSKVFYYYKKDNLRCKVINSKNKTNNRILISNGGFHITNKKIEGNIQAYFEVKILQFPTNSKGESSISIGFSQEQESIFRDLQLGKSGTEFGYNSNTGNLLSPYYKKDIKIGPVYNKGDIIGCGFTDNSTLFYTINGIFLGLVTINNTPCRSRTAVNYPSVCITGEGAKIELIFKNFYYNPIQTTPEWNINTYALRLVFSSKYINKFVEYCLHSKYTSTIGLILWVYMDNIPNGHDIAKNPTLKALLDSCPNYFRNHVFKQEKQKDSMLCEREKNNIIHNHSRSQHLLYNNNRINIINSTHNSTPSVHSTEKYINKCSSLKDNFLSKYEYNEIDSIDSQILSSEKEEIILDDIVQIFISCDTKNATHYIKDSISVYKIKQLCISTYNLTEGSFKLSIEGDKKTYLKEKTQLTQLLKGDNFFCLVVEICYD